MTTALNAPWGAPCDIGHGASASTFTNITLDADGEYIATVFIFGGEAGSTDTITHVGFRQGAVTGTPTNAYDIGIMGLDSAGVPDGSFVVSAQFTPTAGNDGRFIWIAITGTALTAGTPYALVLRANSSASGANLTTATNVTPLPCRMGLPYGVTNVTGSAVKNGANTPAMACKSATKVYGTPASAVLTSNAYGGSGVEACFLFTIPTQFCSTYKVAGVRWIDSTAGFTGADSSVLSLYSTPVGTPTLLNQTSQIDSDVTSATGSTFRVFTSWFDGTLDTLTAGTQYAIGFAKNTANEGALYSIGVETQADFDGWDFGRQTTYGTRNPAAYPPGTGAPGFTETATKRVFAELILADITPPAGGGGTTIAGTTLCRGLAH